MRIGAKAGLSFAMSMLWRGRQGPSESLGSRAKRPSTGIWRRAAFRLVIRMCFGADAARSSRARFRRSRTPIGAAKWGWIRRRCADERAGEVLRDSAGADAGDTGTGMAEDRASR